MKTDRWDVNLEALRSGRDLVEEIKELRRELRAAKPWSIVINGVEYFKERPVGDH